LPWIYSVNSCHYARTVGNGPNDHGYPGRTDRLDQDNLPEQAPFAFPSRLTQRSQPGFASYPTTIRELWASRFDTESTRATSTPLRQHGLRPYSAGE
jgi:hypothetical protein